MTRFTESTALIARMEAAGVAQALPAARARLAGTQQQLALQRKQYQELQEEEAKRSKKVGHGSNVAHLRALCRPAGERSVCVRIQHRRPCASAGGGGG